MTFAVFHDFPKPVVTLSIKHKAMTCLLTKRWATAIPSFCALSAWMYSWMKVRMRGYFPKSCTRQQFWH